MSNLIIVILDQIFVSGGNFITLALGAHYLSLDDQGKLCYLITLYAITTLINVALIFSVAPVIKKSLHTFFHALYRQQLLLLQFLLALVISLVLSAFLYIFRSSIHWDIGKFQFGFVFLFLMMQQMVDFFRRSAYVFEGIRQALITSISLYTVRIASILIICPSTFSEMLTVLIVSCFTGVLPSIFLYKRKALKIYSKGFHKTSLTKHLNLSKWNVFSVPLGWISFFLPAFLIGIFETPSLVAIYVTLRSLSGSANILLELLETFIPKWLSDFDKKKHLLGAAIKLLTIGTAVWISILIFICIFGRNLILVFFGREYINYLPILIIFWAGNGVHFITRVIGLYYRTNQNTFLEFFGSVGGGLGLLVSLPLILHNALYGAAFSTIIVPVGILFSQLLYYLYKKYKKNNI